MPNQSTKIAYICESCGVQFFRHQSQFKDQGPARFCSRSCRWAPRPLLDHPTDPTALIVPLTQGKEAIIDRADGERVGAFTWSACWTGKAWYARRMDHATEKHVWLHRWILDAADNRDVDHWDGDGLNCRGRNLREATESQNGANRGAQVNSPTGLKGVFPTRNGKRWRAQIRHNGTTRHIGVFDTIHEAADAYDVAAIELHGEFAHLNFPA